MIKDIIIDSLQNNGGAMAFYVYQSSNDGGLFCVTGEPCDGRMPVTHHIGTWLAFTNVTEQGRQRVRFSAGLAHKNIIAHGYHLFRAKHKET